MASTIPKPGRKLGELLQEQQEPFVLDVYLLERGCKKRILKTYGSSGCCPINNSGKIVKRSTTINGVSKKVKGISQSSKLLKSIYNKFVLIYVNPRIKGFHGNDKKLSIMSNIKGNNKDLAESDKLAPAHSMAVFSLCSESQCVKNEVWNDSILTVPTTEQTESTSNTKEAKVKAERQISWNFIREDSKQLSPVSVLQEIASHEVYPRYCTRQEKTTRRDMHSSTPIRRNLMLSTHSKKQSQEHMDTERKLQQTKQLLLDCVREVLEGQRQKRRKQPNDTEFLSCEELGKLINEKVIVRGRQIGDEINLEISDLAMIWGDIKTEKKEIAFDIGDCLFKEIVDEVITDLISLLR